MLQKIAVIARGGFKAVQVLVAGYPEFRSRHPSKAGKCRALGFSTGCAATVNDAPHLGRKFIGYVAKETATPMQSLSLSCRDNVESMFCRLRELLRGSINELFPNFVHLWHPCLKERRCHLQGRESSSFLLIMKKELETLEFTIQCTQTFRSFRASM